MTLIWGRGKGAGEEFLGVNLRAILIFFFVLLSIAHFVGRLLKAV